MTERVQPESPAQSERNEASPSVQPERSGAESKPQGERTRARPVNAGDRNFHWALRGLAWGLLVLAAGILVVLLDSARPAFSKVGFFHFLTGTSWDPVRGMFGALPFIYGTLVTSAIAVAIAIPVALGLSLFSTQLAPRKLAPLLTVPVELLAAIPSVVYGLWGLFILVPFLRESVEPFLQRHFGSVPLFRGPPIGLGYLAAGAILAVMILPTIAAISTEVMKTVPISQVEAAFALGATRWEAIRASVLPYSRTGILGAVLLGLGRALGETMAVTMVIGNQPAIHASLFAPGYTLPSVIANEFAEATSSVHVGALAALALVLFGITLVLNALARVLVRLSGRGLPRGVAM